MLYKRSSFITWLSKVKDCEITPLEGRVMKINNGPAVYAYMMVDRRDRIDYEEILKICNELYLTSIPGDKDLIRIE